jgi:hypothetical protein
LKAAIFGSSAVIQADTLPLLLLLLPHLLLLLLAHLHPVVQWGLPATLLLLLLLLLSRHPVLLLLLLLVGPCPVLEPGGGLVGGVQGGS